MVAEDTSSTKTVDSATSTSWSHTCSGSNRILIVCMAFRGTVPTGVSVTYNSVAMTEIDTSDISNLTTGSMFSLADPATGSNTIAVSWTNTNDFAGGAISFTGAKGTPGAKSVFSSAATTTPSISVSSSPGEIVIDVLACAGASTQTVGSGQTQKFSVGTTPDCSVSTEPGAAGNVAMDWTINVSDQAIQIGVSIKDISIGAIKVGPGGIKTRVIRRDVPVDKGLEFGTTRQEGNVSNLVVQEESLVDPRETVGFI